jgi:hypothetical protein
MTTTMNNMQISAKQPNKGVSGKSLIFFDISIYYLNSLFKNKNYDQWNVDFESKNRKRIILLIPIENKIYFEYEKSWFSI